MFDSTGYRGPSMITSTIPLEDHYSVCPRCTMARAMNGTCFC